MTMLLLILLLIHPPSEFIYLSLVKETAALFSTALRKLTVCSSNLLTFYVGKTDRCLFTRLKEHSDSKDSEILRHMKSCEHFYNLNPLLILSFNNPELLPKIVLNNTVIIDKSMNLSLLQYKDALHIPQTEN